jgi:amino acid transporter
MDWLSIAANTAQVIGFLWAIAFGLYVRRATLPKPPIIKFSVLVVATSIVLAITLIIRIFTFFPPPLPSPSYGIDLNAFCTSLGYSNHHEDQFCYSQLNGEQACFDQHQQHNLHLELTDPHDSTSGLCYNSQGHVFGGLDNIDSACQHNTYKGGVSEAFFFDTPATKWVCRTKINMTIACIWRFGLLNMQAHKNEQGFWRCYNT